MRLRPRERLIEDLKTLNSRYYCYRCDAKTDHMKFHDFYSCVGCGLKTHIKIPKVVSKILDKA